MQADAPQAPTPPTPPQPPNPNEILISQEMLRGASPSDVYTAARNQRQELRNQLERLEEQRDDITRELTNEETKGVDRDGLEERLKAIDARISGMDAQVAAADQAVAAAAAIPGAIVEPKPIQRSGPPEEIIAIPIVFTLAVLMPLAIAYSRRIWKRTGTTIAPVPREVQDRLEQMGQAVESIAVEVERIGEGQRFLTRVMSDQGRLVGAGPAQPIPIPQQQAATVAAPEYRAQG